MLAFSHSLKKQKEELCDYWCGDLETGQTDSWDYLYWIPHKHSQVFVRTGVCLSVCRSVCLSVCLPLVWFVGCVQVLICVKCPWRSSCFPHLQLAFSSKRVCTHTWMSGRTWERQKGTGREINILCFFPTQPSASSSHLIFCFFCYSIHPLLLLSFQQPPRALCDNLLACCVCWMEKQYKWNSS